jgi:surface antigen
MLQSNKLMAIALTTIMLSACTESDGSPGRGVMSGGSINKADVGTVAGVIGGGVLGSTIGSGAGSVAATIGGGLLGGWLGNSIGTSLDNADRNTHSRISQRAMETGRTQKWNNSRNGNHGTFTPHKRYKNNDGEYCREYTQVIYVDGKKHTGRGTACRDADGTWNIID